MSSPPPDMTIAASVLFDAHYLEPALVTAFELLQRARHFHHLYLIYLSAGTSVDEEAIQIISEFCASMGGADANLSAITLDDTLPKFQAAHFNNSIIYKSLLPSILPHEKYVLNVDAGILVGERFDAFLLEITQVMCTAEDTAWLIAAHCHDDPMNLLPSILLGEGHHDLYPAGGMLMFNITRCISHNWVGRLLQNYQRCASFLHYAEQELICLTAQGVDLRALPGGDDRDTPFLGLESMHDVAALCSASRTQDCLFFKFIGTLKPWKYWVLDPNKRLWTSRRDMLERVFPISNYALIEANRHTVTHEGFRVAFLKQYDTYIHRIAFQ
jgi:lipopolysaccharide biosynthesis glycosyltransferase